MFGRTLPNMPIVSTLCVCISLSMPSAHLCGQKTRCVTLSLFSSPFQKCSGEVQPPADSVVIPNKLLSPLSCQIPTAKPPLNIPFRYSGSMPMKRRWGSHLRNYFKFCANTFCSGLVNTRPPYSDNSIEIRPLIAHPIIFADAHK